VSWFDSELKNVASDQVNHVDSWMEQRRGASRLGVGETADGRTSERILIGGSSDLESLGRGVDSLPSYRQDGHESAHILCTVEIRTATSGRATKRKGLTSQPQPEP
jgi:hypothetical protein